MTLPDIKLEIINHPTLLQKNTYQRFADTNWGESDDTEETEHEDFFDPPTVIVTATLDDRLVGLCNLHIRKVKYDSQNMHLGGIGGLVTHLQYRHMGISKQIMTVAMDELRNQKIDIALLTTDIPRLGKVYTPYGFVPLNNTYLFTTKSGRVKESRGMVAPVCNVDVFRRILKSDEKLDVGSSNF